MIEAFDGLPDYLKSILINGIYRLQKSKDVSNPATNSNKNEIVLYDEAFSKNRVYYSERRESGYIEPDGMSSANEDYANNLEHFIFNSDKLKKITPSAYDWFSKRYGTKFKK